MNTEDYVPFHVPCIGEEEIAEVAATLRSGWLTTGSRVQRFEREFGEYVGAPHAVAVSSGTAALHLALQALGVGPGDQVITTPLTFCATVNAILHVGARPVLADIADDGNIDPKSVRARLTPQTRAILPVHFAGLPCRMQELWDIAQYYGLRIVEDAAHAVGAGYGKRKIGACDALPFSDAAAFSFYATKNITTAEGGMVATPHADVAARMRVLALHGISADAWKRYSREGTWKYSVVECGWKYNLSDVHAAIGLCQLKRVDDFTRRRTQIAARYTQEFASVDAVECPPPGTGDAMHAWHLYCIRLRTESLAIDRDQFIEELRHRGIGTSVHFIPIPLHPAYRHIPGIAYTACPNTTSLYPRLISLPLYPSLTDEQIDRVVAAVKDTVAEHRVRRFAASQLPV